MKIKNIVSISMLLVMPLATMSMAYAEQICTPQINKTAPDSRFTVSSDGKEVTDNKTGLIWQRCSIGQSWNGASCQGNAENLTWKQALTKAKALGNGYRLPSMKEAMTIVEAQCITPAINTTIFPNFPVPEALTPYQNIPYWTSTPIRNQGDRAYLFDYGKGSGMVQPVGYTDKTTVYSGYLNGYALAVRHK